MKKSIGLLLVALLALSGIALAEIHYSWSFRANDGQLDRIGNYEVFKFADTHLSVNGRYATFNGKDTYNGNGGLQITAITSTGKQVKLNLNLKLIKQVPDMYIGVTTENIARGTYWEKGKDPVRIENLPVTYRIYQKMDGTYGTQVYSDSPIMPFFIENMEAVQL